MTQLSHPYTLTWNTPSSLSQRYFLISVDCISTSNTEICGIGSMDRIHSYENVFIVTADCTIMYAMKKF